MSPVSICMNGCCEEPNNDCSACGMPSGDITLVLEDGSGCRLFSVPTGASFAGSYTLNKITSTKWESACFNPGGINNYKWSLLCVSGSPLLTLFRFANFGPLTCLSLEGFLNYNADEFSCEPFFWHHEVDDGGDSNYACEFTITE